MGIVAKKLFFDLPGKGRVQTVNGSFKPAGESRSMYNADTGPVGPTSESMHGELSFTVPNDGSVKQKELADLVGINITLQDDNGQTWLCRDAFTTEPPTLSGGEISVSMQFKTQEEVS